MWVKTTIEIADNLFKEAKHLMAKEGKTMREVVETSLRSYLDTQKIKKKPFKWRDCSFKGEGLVEGLQEGDWETIRDIIYEGRGGNPVTK